MPIAWSITNQPRLEIELPWNRNSSMSEIFCKGSVHVCVSEAATTVLTNLCLPTNQPTNHSQLQSEVIPSTWRITRLFKTIESRIWDFLSLEPYDL